MQFIVIAIVTIALSLCVFGLVERRGAMLVRLDGRVLLMALIFGAVFLAASCAGYGLGKWILKSDLGGRQIFWIDLVSGLILIGAGSRLILRALSRDSFLEHRMETVDIRHDTLLCLKSCVPDLMAGVVCGLLEVSFGGLMAAVFCGDLAAAAGGYTFGRANGSTLGRGCWAVSGALLCGLGVALQIA